MAAQLVPTHNVFFFAFFHIKSLALRVNTCKICVQGEPKISTFEKAHRNVEIKSKKKSGDVTFLRLQPQTLI